MSLILEQVFEVIQHNLTNDMVILTKPSQVLEVFKGLSTNRISNCTGSFVLVEGKRVYVKTFCQKPAIENFHLKVCFEGDLTKEEQIGLRIWQKKCLN